MSLRLAGFCSLFWAPSILARLRVSRTQYRATELALVAPELNLELAAWSKIWEIMATVKQSGK